MVALYYCRHVQLIYDSRATLKTDPNMDNQGFGDEIIPAHF